MQEILCGEIILCLIQCLLLEHYCCRSSFSLLFIVCSTVKVIISIQIYFEFCCYISRQFNISLYTALFCCDWAIASIAKTIGKNGPKIFFAIDIDIQLNVCCIAVSITESFHAMKSFCEQTKKTRSSFSILIKYHLYV